MSDTLTSLRTAIANLRRIERQHALWQSYHYKRFSTNPHDEPLARAEAEVNAALDALEGAQGVEVKPLRDRIPDDMLESIARHMFERILKGAEFPSYAANGYARATRERYMNAAHSALLLAAEYWEAPKPAALSPAHVPEGAKPPQIGDYVLATKYSDGDPGDPWAVGFYFGMKGDRHIINDSDGNSLRPSGFRRVGIIDQLLGAWLLSVANALETSPPGSVNLWNMIAAQPKEPLHD